MGKVTPEYKKHVLLELSVAILKLHGRETVYSSDEKDFMIDAMSKARELIEREVATQ